MFIFYVSDAIYDNPAPQTMVYDITAGEAAVPTQSVALATHKTSLAERLHQGDVAKGIKVFGECSICHTPLEKGPNRVGPNLWNVVARQVGEMPGFSYSRAMRALRTEGKHWDYETLDAFLRSPQHVVRGTAMSFVGIKNDQDRADLILYLRSLSKTPPPLPQEENKN